MTSDLSAPGRLRQVRVPPAPLLPDVVIAREVPDVAAARARDGSWSRVRRGAYLPCAAGEAADGGPAEPAVQLSRIAAVAAQLDDPVLSHDSAALLWGAPLWRTREQVHVTQRSSPSGTRSADIRRHRAALDPDDVTRRAGVRLTTLDRTLLDCALTMRPLAGLVAADGLVRRGADLAAASAALDERRRANGARLGRWVLDHADGRSESPGESLTRYILLAHGLPRPELQVPVVVDGRTVWADLGWPEWKVVVEFDGMVKYRELAGGAPVEVVIAEKRRQESMEDAGFSVVRAMHRDLLPGGRFVERVLRRLPPEIARRARPRRELLLPTAFE